MRSNHIRKVRIVKQRNWMSGFWPAEQIVGYEGSEMLALQSGAGTKVEYLKVGATGMWLIDAFKVVVQGGERRAICVMFFAFSVFPRVSVSRRGYTPPKKRHTQN